MIKFLKIIGILSAIVAASYFCGCLFVYLEWNYPCDPKCPDFSWLNYFTGYWLARLLGADGEAAYEADDLEVMINCFAFFIMIWLLFTLGRYRRRCMRLSKTLSNE